MRRCAAGENWAGSSGHLVSSTTPPQGRIIAALGWRGWSVAAGVSIWRRDVADPAGACHVKVGRKRPLEELSDVQGLIRRVESDLGDEGRVLVRYSGTEAKARVMIEGPDQGRIQMQAEEIAAALVAACLA